MTVVLDSNTLIQMFGRRSRFVELHQALLDGRVTIAVSTAILHPYRSRLSPIRCQDLPADPYLPLRTPTYLTKCTP